jgi:hypothetical protein
MFTIIRRAVSEQVFGDGEKVAVARNQIGTGSNACLSDNAIDRFAHGDTFPPEPA